MKKGISIILVLTMFLSIPMNNVNALRVTANEDFLTPNLWPGGNGDGS